MKSVLVQWVSDSLRSARHRDVQPGVGAVPYAFEDRWVYCTSLRWRSPVPVGNAEVLCSGNVSRFVLGHAIGNVLHDAIQDLLVESQVWAMPRWEKLDVVGTVSPGLSWREAHTIPRHEGSTMDTSKLIVTRLVRLRHAFESVQSQQVQVPLGNVLLQLTDLKTRVYATGGQTGDGKVGSAFIELGLVPVLQRNAIGNASNYTN